MVAEGPADLWLVGGWSTADFTLLGWAGIEVSPWVGEVILWVLNGSRAAAGWGRCWEGVDGALWNTKEEGHSGQGNIKGGEVLSEGWGWEIPLGTQPWSRNVSHARCYDFPFLFHFTLLFDPHSIWTVFLFHSHVTSPWGSPCSPYLWLTSLEAYFLFYSRTALHCLTLPGTALWLILTPFHLEAAPPLYFPSVWLVMTQPLSFTRLPFALPSTYKYLVG